MILEPSTLRRVVLRALAAFALAAAAAAANACPALFDHRFNSLVSDKPVDLCQYAGKVVLVVNTASHCGFTPQYAGLEQLYRKYRDQGVVVLGFPANDFGRQEPGNNGEIARFCEENFGVSFPMFGKAPDDKPLRVNPFYARLIASTGRAPQWNFHKYLIDKRGRVTSFDSDVEPDSAKLVRAIESALAG
jgi:glutathione peroxidase